MSGLARVAFVLFACGTLVGWGQASYTRLDANVLVDLVASRLGLALVSENLTNAPYVTSGTATAFFAGPPRRLAATLTAGF